MNDIAAIRRLLEVLVLIALFVTAYFAKDLLLPILLGFLLENFVAQPDALVADVDGRPGDDLVHLAHALAAK